MVGEHSSLLRTAADILKKTNAEVEPCYTSELAEHWTHEFDLIVLCHTVNSSEAASIAADARLRWPDIRILQLLRFDFGSVTTPPYADAAATSGVPQDLFTTAVQLLDRSASSRQVA
jgi:hypothetical protein